MIKKIEFYGITTATIFTHFTKIWFAQWNDCKGWQLPSSYTNHIDIRGFFYYNTLVNFSPLVLNVVWCYAKKIDCIFNILSISFYLDQNKFWYISGCLALSKNNFSNFYILIVLTFLNQKPITAWYQVNLCPWMVLLKNNNCIFYIISIFQ